MPGSAIARASTGRWVAAQALGAAPHIDPATAASTAMVCHVRRAQPARNIRSSCRWHHPPRPWHVTVHRQKVLCLTNSLLTLEVIHACNLAGLTEPGLGSGVRDRGGADSTP